MTFAPQRTQPLGKIAEVLAQNIVHAADLKNDGDHKYMTTEIPVSDPPLPTSSASQYIYVPLTTSQLDVVEFQKSFFTMKVSFTIKFNNFEAADEDNDSETGTDFIYYFLGLKHSTDIIGDYQIRYKGKPIAIQPNATVESFLYQSLRDESQIKYRPGNHTTSETASVLGGKGSFCGTDINIEHIHESCGEGQDQTFNVSFSLVIPFTDIQAFQQFDDYPTALFGDLELGFKINTGALVTKIQDPIENYHYLEKTYIADPELSKITKFSLAGDKDFNREFVQIGDKFRGITHAKDVAGAINITAKDDVSFSVVDFEVETCSAIISGYNIESSALERMRKTYSEQPWVVFTQTVDVHSFNHSPSSLGIETTQQVRFNNTSDIILLFPTTPNEAHGTVFKNPMLSNLSLYTMGQVYPQTPLKTRSPECTQLMLNSCINKNCMPQKDFATSLIQERWNGEDNFKTGLDDATTFILDLKVERSSALGLMNDGLDSDGKNESVRLHARPEYTEDDGDLYCHSDNTPPPPLIVTVGDAYWAFNSKNGGNCMISSLPFEKQIPTFMAN